MNNLMFWLRSLRHEPIKTRTERGSTRGMMRVWFKCNKCGKQLGYRNEVESEKHHA
jgi:acetyl-CoA carboxylase beta subunit